MPSFPRALITACLLAAAAAGLVAQGGPAGQSRALISEIHHPGSSPQGPGDGPPAVGARYVELMNPDPGATPPGLDLSGSTLTAVVPGAVSTLTFPPGTFIPPPAPGTSQPGVLVVTESSLGLANELVLPAFFAGVPQLGAPGTPARLCIRSPQGVSPVLWDEVLINGNISGPCSPPPGHPPFNPAPAPVNGTLGHVNRALFTRSLTGYDYETVTGMPTPGVVNPPSILDHINGFQVGQPGSTGVPLNPPTVTPAGVMGTADLTAVPVRAVRVDHHPEHGPIINDPQYDPVLQAGAITIANAGYNANDPTLAGITFPTGLNWDLVVSTPAGTGTLTIDMGPVTQAYAAPGLVPAPTSNGSTLRVTRVLSDFQTDGTATASGNTTEAQNDVLPAATGGGDVWCEIIIYDTAGNAYKAKVRNWPPNPQNCAGTGTPTLGLGDPGGGALDVVAICYPPQAEIYILPTLAVSSPTGSGPLLGINPDALTFTFLSLPLGTDPAHVNVDGDGIYLFQVPSGTLPTGFSVDAVSFEVVPGVGIGGVSNVATITL